MAKIKIIEHPLHVTVVKRTRKDGEFFEVICRYKDPDSGKHRTMSMITDVIWRDKKILKDYVMQRFSGPLIQRVEAYLEGLENSAKPKKDITVSDYLIIWYDKRKTIFYQLKGRITETTLHNDESTINVIKPYFDAHPVLLSRLREDHINDLLKYLKETKKDNNNYLRHKQDFMCKVIARAFIDGYIDHNPLLGIEKIKMKKRPEKVTLTVEQLRILLERVKGNELEPLVYIMVYLGVRLGEACGITWDNVDFTNNTIKIEKQMISHARTSPENVRYGSLKTDHSYRTLYMPNDLKVYLLQLREQQEQDRIYCGNSYVEPSLDVVVRKWNGRDISKETWRQRFNTFIKHQPDLPRITPHSLRHSFNSVLANADISEVIREKNMGTSGRVLRDTYTHADDKAVKGAMDTLNDLLSGDSDQHDNQQHDDHNDPDGNVVDK